MRFLDIPLADGAAATADPRTTPEGVPDSLLLITPKNFPNTDTAPPYLALTLEGAASDTIAVSVWAMAEDERPATGDPLPAADRRFYLVKTGITVTVGQLVTCPAPPGKFYLQLGTAPSPASILRVGFMPAAIS